MYSPENGPRGRQSRLLINLEDQLGDQVQLPWLLEELQGELEMEKEAFGVVDPDSDGLDHDWGDDGAPVEGYHSPWR